jgi:hypothetical protein
MVELFLCSLLTLLPDYLFRRYVQGKRFGKEITFYSVWFELRWGITGCLILTVLLITTVFYNHPATTNVTLLFRTVPIVPETIGRVAEVHVPYSGEVKKGQPLFTLDNSKQQAAVETARRKISEVDAAMAVAQLDVAKAEAQIEETWTPSSSCSVATPASWRSAISRSFRLQWTVVRAPLPLPPPQKRAPRHGCPSCCRPKRPQPKVPSSRPKWNWGRR